MQRADVHEDPPAPPASARAPLAPRGEPRSDPAMTVGSLSQSFLEPCNI